MLELAWEGWRRQDLVRFGKFNDAITDRPKTEAYLQVFPIHANTLAVNQNLTQTYENIFQIYSIDLIACFGACKL